jgi:UDP-N-acetylmuramoyl-L-alanyl-D-glutamate--2,6-diaminopimelate ligase
VKQKKFSALLPGLTVTEMNIGSDPLISGIVYDSRQAKAGSLFVALSGEHTDGHLYIRDAVRRGARAVVCENKRALPHGALDYALVPNTHYALSHLAARFYDYPSDRLYVIGVTGTDGKSSTVWFIHQLLQFCGFASGFISTTNYQTGKKALGNPFRQSTPEAPEIHSLLYEMLLSGKRFAVVEATSHGLSDKTNRLRHVRFTTGVFTNISHEHLEFHGTLRRYRADKANLFRRLGAGPVGPKPDTPGNMAGRPPGFAVLNRSARGWRYFARACRVPPFTYGIDAKKADLDATGLEDAAGGTNFLLSDRTTRYPVLFGIPGRFNVENLLAALLTVSRAAGIPISSLVPHISSLRGVTGRMHAVDLGQPFGVIVDFAHTPAAFRKLLPFMRGRTKGRLICVFGSAGERDTAKRPQQGRIASEFCDVVILTDEDPRAEDSMDIIHDIAAGCKGLEKGRDLLFIPHRDQALFKAFSLARPGDTVLLLGKGHEKSIIYKDGALAWDEIGRAENILGRMGYNKAGDPQTYRR